MNKLKSFLITAGGLAFFVGLVAAMVTWHVFGGIVLGLICFVWIWSFVHDIMYGEDKDEGSW